MAKTQQQFTVGLTSMALFFTRPVLRQQAHRSMLAFANEYPEYVRYDEANDKAWFTFESGEAVVINFDYNSEGAVLFRGVFIDYMPETQISQTGYLSSIDEVMTALWRPITNYFGRE